jgi:hypothetical protein
MSYPKNPNEIVLKNKFYPNGLTEKNIYEYYIKNKPKILNQVKDRDLMFIIFPELNKPIMKKKHKGKYLKLTPKNYEELITGRTVSIHSTMNMYEDICIIDIDSDNWNQAKIATDDVYNALISIPFINTVEIRYTGKSSFHLYCTLPKKIKVDNIRGLMENYLIKNKKIRKNYTIQKKRERGIPNIDLYRNVKGANFITLHSLSFIGLKCMDIPYNKLKVFNKNNAII